jgi:fatty-acyl-CoA synthase
MNGLMMQQPLLISTLLTHAERHHGEQEIVSRRVEGDFTAPPIAISRSARGAWPNALASRSIKFGDRIATLAWNGYRHMELYYAVSGSGAVLHTLNPSLHPDQVVVDRRPRRRPVLFFDLTFLPLVKRSLEGEDDQDVRRDDRPRTHAGDHRNTELCCATKS